jgi:hypothetical protein
VRHVLDIIRPRRRGDRSQRRAFDNTTIRQVLANYESDLDRAMDDAYETMRILDVNLRRR